jgi:predicted transcriptional regulator
MSQELCYKYLVRRRGKIKTTKEIARILKISPGSAARNLRKLSEDPTSGVEKIEGKSKGRGGQIGNFWVYHGRLKLTKNG